MGLLALNLPVIGQSSATEDQKVRDALAAIQTDYNGNLTDANIAATAAIQQSKLANGATGLALGSFSAHRATALNLATASVVIFDNDSAAGTGWDVSGWYDTATGVFTPQVAGYYRLSACVSAGVAQAVDVTWQVELQKNAVTHRWGQFDVQRGAATTLNSTGNWLVQANGTTDAFRIVLNHSAGGTPSVSQNATGTYFQGELVGRS